jgi:HK97 family phage major capsid protein
MTQVERSIDIKERGEAISKRLEAPGKQVAETRSEAHPLTPAGQAGSAALRDAVTVAASGGEFSKAHDYAQAFDTWMRSGMNGLSQEKRSVLQQYNQNMTFSNGEYRDLSVGTNSAGGFTVPPGFLQRITDALKAYGGMLAAANVIDTDSGQPLQWPTADDTGNVGAILAENTAAPTQDITFGTKTLSAFMYTSKMVKVSYQLLNDSAFDLGAWLPDKFAQRIGRAINAHFTNGTGGGTQPTGMIPNLTTGKVGATGQTLTVTYDDIIDLIHSIDPAYRNGGGSFMMADSTLKAVRKLKDTQGRPLWEPSLQQNTPSSLVGYPILINQDMPVMAANAKSIAFGNFREAYVIRQVQGVQLKRFDERFADALQVGFLSFARYDGTTDDLNAAKLYVNSAT